MTDPDEDTSFDTALRHQLRDGGEPDDDGFSLRVMAALPPHVAQHQRRWARRVRRAQWAAISIAACGVAVLLAGAPLDAPRAVAAAALMGLLVYWSIPSRWSRG